MHKIIVTLFLVAAGTASAWNYEGHRIVAAVAVESLPQDFPQFARTADASDAVQFNSGLPDRWRILQEPALQHVNEPDHYVDLEEMEQYGLTADTLPVLRNELTGLIYMERKLHPDKFEPIDPEEDKSKVYSLFGLLPYAINENYLTLKAEFMSLQKMAEYGAKDSDVEHARADILHTMGVLSHFVGDGAQPLHTTIHHHGWVGINPKRYTQNPDIHSLIDGGVVAAAGITFDSLKGRITPAQSVESDNMFAVIMKYLAETHALVEPLYRLEKRGDFKEERPSRKGKAFVETQLLRGGQFLGALYYSAYLSAQSELTASSR